MQKHKGTKTEQLAQFLLEQGEYMSAIDIVQAGFRFDDEALAPTVHKVQSLMSNFAKVIRYVYDRRPDVRRKNGYQIKMNAINERHSVTNKKNPTTACRNSQVATQQQRWQQVLRSW
ncbi:hypothetical protein [Aeromonas dhakensis]|uniref:hypothetical protein n=1 Tax=Aeromonas dhakensis TaxID=196024 RepID=UPI003CF83E54